MLYDENYYKTLLIQVFKFLESENKYIYNIKCSDIKFSNSFGFTFSIKFKTFSGYSVEIQNEADVFGVDYENCNGENTLSNVIDYNYNLSEKNIIKAIRIFKILDIKRKLWVSKWTDQSEITIFNTCNNISVISANDFYKYRKKYKINFIKKLYYNIIFFKR